ncbi:MAG: hypothetical protein KJ046_17055 [Anaerolineae bacterium]|nr:hypothetical protein [Anaerolineae bacterium]
MVHSPELIVERSTQKLSTGLAGCGVAVGGTGTGVGSGGATMTGIASLIVASTNPALTQPRPCGAVTIGVTHHWPSWLRPTISRRVPWAATPTDEKAVLGPVRMLTPAGPLTTA